MTSISSRFEDKQCMIKFLRAGLWNVETAMHILRLSFLNYKLDFRIRFIDFDVSEEQLYKFILIFKIS